MEQAGHGGADPDEDNQRAAQHQHDAVEDQQPADDPQRTRWLAGVRHGHERHREGQRQRRPERKRDDAEGWDTTRLHGKCYTLNTKQRATMMFSAFKVVATLSVASLLVGVALLGIGLSTPGVPSASLLRIVVDSVVADPPPADAELAVDSHVLEGGAPIRA